MTPSNIIEKEFRVPYIERTTVGVYGPKEQVERFIRLCKAIQYLCKVGASRTVTIDVDGDGAGNLSFNIDPRYDGITLDDINTDRDPVRVPGINDY